MSCVPVRISCSLSCFYQWPSYLAALSSPESQPLPAMHLTINFFIISKVMLMINQWIILGRYKGYRRKNKVKDEDRSDRVKGRWKDIWSETWLKWRSRACGDLEKNIPGKEKTKQKAPKVEVFKNQQENPCCWNSESEERVWDEAGEVAKAGSVIVSKATATVRIWIWF